MNVVEQVQSVAKTICKRETQTFPAGASICDSVRQGDVYITLLGEVPAGYKLEKNWDLQLAPGTTQGSRHVLDLRSGVQCYRHEDASEFDGPVLVISELREVTHPQHGHWILPPNIYGFSYQRTQDSLDQQRRVAD